MHNRHVAGSLSAIPALIVFVGILLIAAPVGRAQETSSGQIARLKQAVVIVTTYDESGKPMLQGSGFFIDSGQVATNFHVIKNASQIRVETFDRTVSIVRNILATDEKNDLALIQLDSTSRQSAFLTMNAAAPAEGELITVISSPQGSRWKVTRGAIGLLWEFQGWGERLQISAAIAPGSSGGPVINAGGEVIGVAAMYFNSVDDLNFAVPIARLQALQLRAQHLQARLTKPGVD